VKTPCEKTPIEQRTPLNPLNPPFGGGVGGLLSLRREIFAPSLSDGLDLPDQHFVPHAYVDQPAPVDDATTVFRKRDAAGGGVELALPAEGRHRLVKRGEVCAIGGYVGGIFARFLDDIGHGEFVGLELVV